MVQLTEFLQQNRPKTKKKKKPTNPTPGRGAPPSPLLPASPHVCSRDEPSDKQQQLASAGSAFVSQKNPFEHGDFSQDLTWERHSSNPTVK